MARLYRLKQMMKAVALLSILAAAAFPFPYFVWCMWCDWVPDAILARLHNASRAEVRQLLGDPDHTNRAKEEEAEMWAFGRPWRVAEFQIYFDSDGRVTKWWYDR